MKFSKGALVLVALMMVFTPVVLSAQMAPSQDACMQAKMDAQNDVSSGLWFGSGCLLGFPVGWPLLPMMIEPTPPATRLIGMPPDYIAYYTQCYKEAGKKVQSSKALTGCILNTVGWVGYWVFWSVLVAASTPTYY